MCFNVCVSPRGGGSPSAVVQVDDDGLVSELLERLVMVAIHVPCVGKTPTVCYTAFTLHSTCLPPMIDLCYQHYSNCLRGCRETHFFLVWVCYFEQKPQKSGGIQKLIDLYSDLHGDLETHP